MSEIKILQKAFKKKKRPKPAVLRKKIAELPSLYSDTIVQVTAQTKKAGDALALIYLSLYFPYWSTDKLISHLAQQCYLQNYEGKWKIVQEFLETKLQTPKEFEDKYIELFGENDFYGNFLYRSYKQSQGLKIKDITLADSRPVKKPVYRRGYKDKGSLRLPFQNHGQRPFSSGSTERIDRRHLVSHPLLGKEKLANGDDAKFTHLERSEHNDYLTRSSGNF